MASLTITPERPAVGDAVVIDGAGFVPNATVRLNISEGGVVVKLTASAVGGFKSDKVIDWAPTRVGIFTLVAEDGTNRVEEEIQVWSS